MCMNSYAEVYQASAALEKFVLDACPLHYVSPDAPESYKELSQYYDTLAAGDPIPVAGGGSEYTMYSQESINHAWRAYHYGIHIVHELDFSLDDEMRTCEVQIEHMRMYHDHYGFTDQDYAAVRADVVGQAMYYAKHKKYVDDQRAFVTRCLEVGILKAIEEEV